MINDSDTDGENKDIFLDGTGWEGSDEWIRYQFKVYLLHMLRSSELDGKDIHNLHENYFNSKLMCILSYLSVRSLLKVF